MKKNTTVKTSKDTKITRVIENVSDKAVKQLGRVLAGADRNNGIIIDTHNDMERPINIAGLAVLKNGQAVELISGNIFSLNLVIAVDGKTYLTGCSIGGNMDTRNTTIEEAVAKYNEGIDRSVASGWLSSDLGKIAAYSLL